MVVFEHLRELTKAGGKANNGGRTVAYVKPTAELMEYLNKNVRVSKVFIPIGIAKCSKHDRYNKATGRQLAESRLDMVKMEVDRLFGPNILILVNRELDFTIIIKRTPEGKINSHIGRVQ